jgi:hypothetical protein
MTQSELSEAIMIARLGVAVGEALGTMMDTAEIPSARVPQAVVTIARQLVALLAEEPRALAFAMSYGDKMIDTAARAFVRTGSASQAYSTALDTVMS